MPETELKKDLGEGHNPGGDPASREVAAEAEDGKENEEVDVEPAEDNEVQDLLGVGLDSGTGETKVLLFRKNGESVETQVLSTMPSLKGLFIGEVDNVKDVVETLVQTVEDIVAQFEPAYQFAGVTSWYRTTTDNERDKVEKFFESHLPSFTFVKVSGVEEAFKESIAVSYAAEKAKIGKPELQIAAGGGSMNLVQGAQVFSIEYGFRFGQGELLGEEPRSVVFERLIAKATKTFTSFKEINPDFVTDSPLMVIGISAAFYAAKAAKIDTSNGMDGKSALESFQKMRDTFIDCSEEEAKSPMKDKRKAQTISNLIIFAEFFRLLVHPESRVYFKREWLLDGVPFVTTWSAGHFLQLITEREKAPSTRRNSTDGEMGRPPTSVPSGKVTSNMGRRTTHMAAVKNADTLENDFHAFAVCPSGDRFSNPADKPTKAPEDPADNVMMARGAFGGGVLSAEPSAIEKIISGTLKSFEAMEIAAPEILEWLKSSLSQVAKGDQEQLKTRLKQLLGSFFFTANLDALGLWDGLKSHCRREALSFGAPLKEYFDGNNLEAALGSGLLPILGLNTSFGRLEFNERSEILPKDIPVHKIADVIPSKTLDPQLRQDRVIPIDFKRDPSLSQMCNEQIYIHLLRMIGMGINERFQSAVKETCERYNGDFRAGNTKGYTRMKQKCLSKDEKDFYYEPFPRPSRSFDIIRNASTFDDVQDFINFIQDMMKQDQFGRHPICIDNMFTDNEEESRNQFHYRKVTINWLYTPGLTYGELVREQDQAEDGKDFWDRYYNFINIPGHGVKDISESWTSWREQIKEAHGILTNSRKLQDRQVQFIVETQVLMRPYKDARVKYHMLYKISMAPTPRDLCSDFNSYDDNDLKTSESYDGEQREAVNEVERVVAAKGNVCHLALFETHMTMLGRACANGHHLAVAALLEVPKIRVNQTSATGSTPLYLAARSGHLLCVRLLLANPKIQVNGLLGQRSRTPLYIASQKGYTAVVKELLGHRDVNVNARFWVDGTTSLYMAAQQGHASVVALLLSHPDIDINASREEDDTTSLYTATCYGHTDVVKLLCSRRECNLKFCSSNGTSPLMIAMFKAGTTDIPENPCPREMKEIRNNEEERSNIVEILAEHLQQREQSSAAAESKSEPANTTYDTQQDAKEAKEEALSPKNQSEGGKREVAGKHASSMCTIL